MVSLVHPGKQSNHHRAVTEAIDDHHGCRVIENGRVLAQVIHCDLFYFAKIEVGGNADIEIETTEGVSGEVEQGGVHDDSVGDAEVIAIEGDEDCITGREECDFANLAVNFYGIADFEGVASAQEDTGEVVFSDVLEGETDGDTGEAGGSHDGTDDGCGVEQLEGEEDCDEVDYELCEAGEQLFPHGGEFQAIEEAEVWTEEFCDEVGCGKDEYCGSDERKFDDYSLCHFPDFFIGGCELAGDFSGFLEAIEGEDDALRAFGEGDCVLAMLLTFDGAAEGDDARFDCDLHGIEAAYGVVDFLDPLENDVIVGDVLDFDGSCFLRLFCFLSLECCEKAKPECEQEAEHTRGQFATGVM